MNEHFVGQVTQKAVLRYKNSYVLVRESGDTTWILPGGRLNKGEQPGEGLLRELKEELGIDCVVESILSVAASHSGGKIKTPKFFVFYHASTLPDQALVMNNGSGTEIAEVAFVTSLVDLNKYPMRQNQKDVIEKALRNSHA